MKNTFDEEGIYPSKELRDLRLKILAEMKKAISETASVDVENNGGYIIAKVQRNLIAIELEEKALHAINKLENHLGLID